MFIDFPSLLVSLVDQYWPVWLSAKKMFKDVQRLARDIRLESCMNGQTPHLVTLVGRIQNGVKASTMCVLTKRLQTNTARWYLYVLMASFGYVFCWKQTFAVYIYCIFFYLNQDGMRVILGIISPIFTAIFWDLTLRYLEIDVTVIWCNHFETLDAGGPVLPFLQTFTVNSCWFHCTCCMVYLSTLEWS